jgi:hypothetical protein
MSEEKLTSAFLVDAFTYFHHSYNDDLHLYIMHGLTLESTPPPLTYKEP